MADDLNAQHPMPPPIQGGQGSRDAVLDRIAETAEYVSRRTLQLDEQVQSVEHIVQHLGALARQLRTLSSNTMLEATRMRMNGPLAEIARQMRRVSQQINESNDDLAVTLRAYQIAMGELREAAESLRSEAQTVAVPVETPRTTPLVFSGRLHGTAPPRSDRLFKPAVAYLSDER
jgi:methyl-accepting chemotaxis protein